MSEPAGSDQVLVHRLLELTRVVAEVGGATNHKAVADIITTSASDLLGADAASLTLARGDGELHVIALRAEFLPRPLPSFPEDAPNAAAEAFRTRKVVFAGSLEEIRRRWPDHFLGTDTPRSLACLPLLTGDACLGVLGLSFPEQRELSEIDRRYLGALADSCAQALQRISATEAAAEASLRFKFLADASHALSASLDYEVTLRRVAQLAVPELADWCAIDLLEGDSLRRVAVSHIDPAKVSLALELWERYPPQMDAPTGAPAVVRTGVTELIERVDVLLAELDVDEEQRQLAEDLQLNSAITVALKARGRSLGVLTLVWAESRRHYSADDIPFAEELARRAAMAIDNAQLHTDTSQAALQLQQAVLPDTYNDSRFWQVAVHYRPAGRSHLVGGDFYDAMTLDDGRLVALVGDVMGRGVAAAAAMAQVRAAARAYLVEDPDPVAVVSRLDSMFTKLDLEQLVTFVYFVIDRSANEATVVSAGHLPPALIGADGNVHLLDPHSSPPLGTGTPLRRASRHPFKPTDVLLAYSDGLVERRTENIEVGLARLVKHAGALAQNSSNAALASLADAVRLADHDDDVTLLAVRPLPV
ncbi:MAG TPA: SpoIIE family protein phosphatase [Acidimicrobiales bacterium]|nr:SpoIIE family protein phosphatase [Acidimicrobiales bacterium]